LGGGGSAEEFLWRGDDNDDDDIEEEAEFILFFTNGDGGGGGGKLDIVCDFEFGSFVLYGIVWYRMVSYRTVQRWLTVSKIIPNVFLSFSPSEPRLYSSCDGK